MVGRGKEGGWMKVVIDREIDGRGRGTKRVMSKGSNWLY